MSYAAIEARLANHGLRLFGGFHPEPSDGTPAGCRSLLLVGPHPQSFWPLLTASAEWRSGLRDPVDRYSRRVIGRLACDLGAKALFPFTGPPFHPFVQWAKRSGQAFDSPALMLVHREAGLMVSFRGALALRERLELPLPQPSPCEGCARPCVTACPGGAVSEGRYDVPRCSTWLESAGGAECHRGCLVRRACPLSHAHARVEGQSAWHMRNFIHEHPAPDPDPPRQIGLG